MVGRYGLLSLILLGGACGGTVATIAQDDAGSGADEGGSLAEGGAVDAARDAGEPRDVVAVPGDAAPDVGTEGCNGRPPLPADVPQPPPPVACGFVDSGANFPLFDKCCSTLSDCLMGTYEFRCCGDTYTFGMNKAVFAAFDAVRAQWGCGACGCASGGNHTEDGLTADFPVVRCDNGYCMTHGQR